MMCPDRETELNEYVDGALAPAARLGVERHLAECAGCREAVAELRRLVAQARDLPSGVEPGRDLWGEIATRIRGREEGTGQRWWRERAFWAGVLAAAAAFVISLGIYRLTARPPDMVVEADYERAAAELSGALAVQRPRLAPETAALVERNLRIIDAAIADSRAALAGDPGNAELRRLFAAAYRQKVELLRWAARAAAS